AETERLNPARAMFTRSGWKTWVSSTEPSRLCEVAPVMTKSVASGDVVVEFITRKVPRIVSEFEKLGSIRPVYRFTGVTAAETNEQNPLSPETGPLGRGKMLRKGATLGS